MDEYIPDRWVVIDIAAGEKKHQRVLAGWSGGYLHGDLWKINSGITEVKDLGDCFDFVGKSGSVYRCYKQDYGMSNLMMSVLNSYQSDAAGSDVSITICDDYERKCNE